MAKGKSFLGRWDVVIKKKTKLKKMNIFFVDTIIILIKNLNAFGWLVTWNRNICQGVI